MATTHSVDQRTRHIGGDRVIDPASFSAVFADAGAEGVTAVHDVAAFSGLVQDNTSTFGPVDRDL